MLYGYDRNRRCIFRRPLASPNQCEMIEKLRDFIFYIRKEKKEDLIVFFVFFLEEKRGTKRERQIDREESKEDCLLFCFVECACGSVFVYFFLPRVACAFSFFLRLVS